ncbi:angiomotin-like 2a [Osmerus mordax]|uniref:angiomotin-like 2a n=1 Tax=Osmerus mordax TaxID=8014 RepID=UPI00350EDC03
MRTAEDSSSTVLHRLIQEQLRYGNPNHTPTLLAIQQQALRGGSGGGGAGTPRSSLESLTQDDSHGTHMCTRQEPQGQEHQGDYKHLESTDCRLYQLHGEELPSYEEAKAHSQYLASQRGGGPQSGAPQSEGQWDVRREHARSLSERLLLLSLERTSSSDPLALSASHSYPQLSGLHPGPHAPQGTGPLQHPDQRGPPPDYPFLVRAPGYMVSHSQEHRHGHYYSEPPPPFHSQHHRFVPVEAQVVRNNIYPTVSSAGPEQFTTTPSMPSNSSVQMEVLLRENERLKRELEGSGEKAARLQKLEQESQRLSEAYEMLMSSSVKREALEKAMRTKLEEEIKRLHDFNRDLRDRLDTVTRQHVAKEVESADHKHHIFAKLLEQNEELQRERELRAQRSSGEEWARRREALEAALCSERVRVRRLEEELSRKRAYVEKVEGLQGSLAQLQVACQKREALELRLRNRLEHELKTLRAQQRQAQGPQESPQSPWALRLQLREREERVLALEADITRWEQKYLEQSTIMQFALDAAATAAAQRDTTIINHSPRHSPNDSFNDDMPLTNHRHQEMENRIRALHGELLEKDAVIRVLQQRSRREQQGLRQALSAPSIPGPGDSTSPRDSTSPGDSPRGKGKSLSDDQTSSLPPHPPAPLRPLSRDSSTQCDAPPMEDDLQPPLAPDSDASEHVNAALNTYKNRTTSDADVVEILI